MKRVRGRKSGLGMLLLAALGAGLSVHAQDASPDKITIFPEEVVDDFSAPHPLGINLNYFQDSDEYLKAPKRLSEALQEMGMKYLRYPGGGKSDYYFFSAPPFDKAIPTMEQSGPGSNASRAEFFNADRTAYRNVPLNFDDFMKICQTTGSEPVIVCAIDTYIMTPDKIPGSTSATRTSPRSDYLRNAVEWVRYANVKHNYNVKYWVLGNETETCYFTDKNGKGYGYTPSMYAKDIVEFSAAMKAVDPSIKVIANGAAWVVKAYLPTAGNSIDYIATSNYPLSQTPYKSYDDWVQKKYNHGDLVKPMEDVLKEVDNCPNLSQEKKASLKVIATEFSSSTWWPNTWPSSQDLGHALFNFDIAGQTMSNPRFLFACFWNTHWEAHDNGSAYNALSDKNEFLPLGQSLALWGNYLFPKMVKTSQADGTVSYATCNEDNNELYYYVINQKGTSKQIELAVSGQLMGDITKVAEMSGDDLKSANTKFTLHEKDVQSGDVVTLDPYSATVFDVKF